VPWAARNARARERTTAATCETGCMLRVPVPFPQLPEGGPVGWERQALYRMQRTANGHVQGKQVTDHGSHGIGRGRYDGQREEQERLHFDKSNQKRNQKSIGSYSAPMIFVQSTTSTGGRDGEALAANRRLPRAGRCGSFFGGALRSREIACSERSPCGAEHRLAGAACGQDLFL
jgi:hypothetical protein